jgi:hypothetical protein
MRFVLQPVFFFWIWNFVFGNRTVHNARSGVLISVGCTAPKGTGVPGTRVTSLETCSQVPRAGFEKKSPTQIEIPLLGFSSHGLTALADAIGHLRQVAFRNFSARGHGHGRD